MFESIYTQKKHKFLKPGENPTWEEDRTDVDTNEKTKFIYNANISLSLELQRQRLPIYHCRNQLLYLLENYQTVVLVGETGCGKSTQIPQYLLESGWCQEGKVVGVTEPRRVAAITLASRVAEESATELGHVVGYSVRFNDCFHPNQTKIKYMTEGILMREMMADPLLRTYSVIVVDEVHERTLNTDIILGLLKKIIRKRRDLRIIVTSATVDAEKLRDFFNHTKGTAKQKDSSVIMSVEGKLYPVDVFFSKEPVPDYVLGAVNVVLEIHAKEENGDILVFLTGMDEVKRAVSALNDAVADGRKSFKSRNELMVLPMYGSLSNNDQLKVFKRTPNNYRKVVVATNIAETSITIPGIVFVVDCGFVKTRFLNSKTGFETLTVVPISQAAAEQRAGRAGRVRPGKVYRLYTERDFERLPLSSPAEMQRCSLIGAVVQLKALGIDNVLRFSFPSAPPARNLLLALELLCALGALSAEDGALTRPLGIRLAEFPLSPLHAKALIAAGEEGCSEEMAIILAVMQVRSLFIEPSSGAERIKARIEHNKFEAEEGDLLTWLNVFSAYNKIAEKESKSWCSRHYINHRAVRRSLEIKGHLLGLLNKFDIPVVSCRGGADRVRKAVTAGFFANAAYLHHSGSYHCVRGDLPLKIDPSSVLYNQSPHKWLVFCELVHTDQMYMKDCLAVEQEWLLTTAPHFYHVDYKTN
ncbi:probable ATP-dependent RNA helicase DHX35 [Nilaparvata lugens]|uniref:probable ATP-dependent RNA helicase DHX35 n=1 Tax=Nilaparvata lugens TaxID=108931 RepID=UPI00193DC9A6|nr:probable ATP-dependent RNA helicase DHX35 [Nilaparvata lugens]